MSRRRTVRAVVFDLDDTLFRERDYVRSGFAAVADALRGRLGTRAEYERWMWRRFASGKTRDVFDALSRHYRLGLSPARIAELVEVYRRHSPAIRPCRGVTGLLERLRRRHLRLALLTDGYLPAQQLKLDALGLAGWFDAIVLAERLGRDAWKPSPRGFHAVRRKLRTPHHACAYVADNPAKDFLAPNRLGWLSVQWRRAGQLHADRPAPPAGRAQRIVRSGPELLRLLTGGP